jgi:hypothetical protein
MKKALVVLLILAVAGGLFAQGFTLTGKVDTWLIPFQYINRDGDTLVGAGLGRDNSKGNGIRAQLSGAAKTDTMGLKIDLQFYPINASDDEVVQFGDNVEVWWKPVDFFQLDVGKFASSTLRGKVGDGSWMDGLTVGSYGADEIFTQFVGKAGVLASFTFGDLFIGALVPNMTSNAFEVASADQWSGGKKGDVYETVNYDDGKNQFGHVYERIQFAVGYTIPDIGLVRAQYVGANASAKFGLYPFADYTWEVTTPKIEAAFALTAVEGLTLDIGGKVPLPVKLDSVEKWNPVDLEWKAENPNDKSKAQAPYQVSVGAIYKVNDALTINGRVDTKFGGSYDFGISGQDPMKVGPEINFHLFPTYDIGIVVLGLDFGLAWYGATTVDGDVVGSDDVPIPGSDGRELNGGVRAGGGIYAQKTWGTCTIRGGLAYSAGTKVNDLKEDAVFTVPVVFEYAF